MVRLLSVRLRNSSREVQQAMGDITQVIEEAIGAHKVVKLFGGQEYEQRRFDHAGQQRAPAADEAGGGGGGQRADRAADRGGRAGGDHLCICHAAVERGADLGRRVRGVRHRRC